ncbi:hypothetical protein [Phenylobacterium sp.]|uniref:hypothetical protein n=1 Tax=Phenylobacterium sp. TaxID=1871053 RepID=UPI0025D8A71B|nr:hypothetical protein [Phenylobacterium sp.]
MKWSIRTFRKGVPEAEQRDASVEFHPGTGLHVIASSNGSFSLAINYCPWCAADLRGFITVELPDISN